MEKGEINMENVYRKQHQFPSLAGKKPIIYMQD